MSSQTSLVAEQVRLRQWAAQIQECQNRPADMKVETWCSEHGITKANYYYTGLEKHAWKLVIQNRLLWNFQYQQHYQQQCPPQIPAM